MKRILEFILRSLLSMALWFRYRIEVHGLEKLNPENLNKPGGVLFLPNHPCVFVDAVSVSLAVWSKYPLRPLVVEYMYELPIVNRVMKMIGALPVPNFGESSNSYKRKKNEKIIQEVIDGLKGKDNFLIFPSGRCKSTSYEALEGASATHRIIQDAPEANIVLVRVKGLWGSSFSRAFTGKTPAFFPVLIAGIKHVFKNLLFFTPRRKVIIEFELLPNDFPYKVGRLEFNKYLEQWYNKPDGLTRQVGNLPGDSLILIPYSMWSKELPKPWEFKESEEKVIELSQIPPEIKNKVTARIAELMNIDPKTIKLDMSPTVDLGMDSLDLAELVSFLQDQYDITNVSAADLSTVGRIMGLATREIEGQGVKEEALIDTSRWHQPVTHQRVQIAPGETIHEVFLNNCDRLGKTIACADMRSGIVSYSQLKLRTLVLAEYIRDLPGKYIGILLPASVAASMTILACQIAGKIPLMVNWTVGPRHLQSVIEMSKVQVVLTSWAFIDRLQNIDFNGMEDMFIMLEEVRRQITLVDKLKAYSRSKMSTQKILKIFKSNTDKNSEAVLLFTSGTESMPKGVPLSHNNILTNQRAMLEAIEIYSDDILFGILPPFHSFGFTVSGLTGILAGLKVAYSPDPTDGKRLAQGFALWDITILCGAPTFVKGLIRAATPDQLRTLRLCVTGAEKLPLDLVHAVEELGKGDHMVEGYGITECSPVLTATRYGKPRKGVGQPLTNVELCIVDLDTHQPLLKGKSGLILARGPNVFSGYLNPGQASPFITIQGKNWYNTGDLGYIDDEGNLVLSGRLKRFIKIGGEMVSLAALEDALAETTHKRGWAPGEEGPVLAVTGKEISGEKPRISVFCRFTLTLEDANQALREAGFSNLIRITAIYQVEEIPLMGTGKINYRKLDEMEQPAEAKI